MYLKNSLFPKRFNQIRTLRVNWHTDFPPYAMYRPGEISQEATLKWTLAWQVIANMAGLRDLYIFIPRPDTDPWKMLWLELESKILAPVQIVTIPEVFVVVLPFRESCTTLDVGESRCEFRLPEREKMVEMSCG